MLWALSYRVLDRLAFREENGEITYLFFRSPTGSYRRLSPIENPMVHFGAFVAFIGAFLGAVFGWSGAALWRWYRGRPSPAGWPRALRWTGGLTALLLLSGSAGLIAWLAGGSVGLATGMPAWLPVVYALPVMGALGAVAMLGGSIQAWREGYWGVAARLHYSVLAATSVAVALLLAYWKLIWLPL